MTDDISSIPNFKDTQIAFQNKTDGELRATAYLFRLMNNNFLVDIGKCITKWGIRLKVPFMDLAVQKTIFKQFCGGVNLMDCQHVIDHLYRYDTLTILDYGAEGKSAEKDLDFAKKELLKAIDFAASNDSVPVVSCKITALVQNEILISKQAGEELSERQIENYEKFIARIYEICDRAHKMNVGMFIDAEESWMQIEMDNVVRVLMSEYNTEKITVYNTYQMYRHDKLAQLKSDHVHAQKNGYILGAKMVRGAYMEKERERAESLGYTSPIHLSKPAVDKDYNEALIYCLDNYEEIAFCCASHNETSNLLLATEINNRKLPRDHKHINFCQLQGMSDHITFNLAQSGFNVAKYVVYGPVKEVLEYLMRRAEENTAVTGEMSRELGLVMKEMNRRHLR